MNYDKQSITDVITDFINTVQLEVLELKTELEKLVGELQIDLEVKINEVLTRLEELRDKVLNWEYDSITEFIADIYAEIANLKRDFDELQAMINEIGIEGQAEIDELINDIKNALDDLWQGILDEVGEGTGSFLEKYKKYIIGAAIILAVIVGIIVIL